MSGVSRSTLVQLLGREGRFSMPEIPEFAEAVIRFQALLRSEGAPTRIVWAFRDDLWQRGQGRVGQGRVFVLSPVTERSHELAEKVFGEGRAKGLVEIAAVAQDVECTLATVWYPKYDHEEVQGWSQNLKLSIRRPLPRVTQISPTLWKLVRWLPGFRRYQESAFWIGTRKWAAA